MDFINYINKASLVSVIISPKTKITPEETFAGCKFLENVIFSVNSQLEVIESRAFAVPKTVKSIAPDAFIGCNKNILPDIKDESLRLSILDNLIINERVKVITEAYSSFMNIECLEIPLAVEEIEENVFDSLKRLKYIKCDPKWLCCFPNSKIEILFVQDSIKQLNKNDFVNMIHLQFIEIPESVDLIEEDAFESCIKLTMFKCGTKHLQFLDKK